MKTFLIVIILAGLACLVPFSSKRPDAIQHVLHLPGGVDSAPKALMGIVVAAFAAAALFAALKMIGRKEDERSRFMTHQWHDTYHHLKTPAHHLDPRSKLVVGLFFVGFVLFTPFIREFQMAAYGALLLAAALTAQIPLKHVLSRIGAVIPFALLMMLSAVFSHLSGRHLLQIFAKSLLSISAMSILAMTTPFPDMLRGLEQFHVPKLLLLFLAFLYRYAAVLGKEAIRLERGWGARYFGRFWARQWFRLGHVLAALLVRSYERAERVYAAMLARGFSSASSFVHVLHFTVWDGIFVTVSISLLTTIWMAHF